MFTSVRNRFSGWHVQYQAAARWQQIVIMAIAIAVASLILSTAVFYGVKGINAISTPKPKVTVLPLDTSVSDKMVTAIEEMKQEMLKQRGDLNEARTEVKGVKKKVDDIGSNLDNLQKGSDALKKRLDDVLESIKNAPKATPMSAAEKPADQVAASEPKAREIPLTKQEPAETPAPTITAGETLPPVGRVRYDRILRDCSGVWIPDPGKEKENIAGFNKLSAVEFNAFSQKCLALLTAAANKPYSAPRSYPQQEGAQVAARAADGYDYSQMRTVRVARGR